MPSRDLNTRHRFLDEAGDTTFFGKGRRPVIGEEPGVSLCFILGAVKFRQPLDQVRAGVRTLQTQVAADPYLAAVPSLNKKKAAGGYYFHATDDPPEARKVFYEYIKTLDMSFEAVVGRKLPRLYASKHNSQEAEFYADLLSHLLKNKLTAEDDLILNIAQRGKTTRNDTLQAALHKATTRFLARKPAGQVRTRVAFNVQTSITEPLLTIADYLCWAVQRVFERGELRYYDFVQEKISLVVDVYDQERWEKSRNYYTARNPLTPLNKLSPPPY